MSRIEVRDVTKRYGDVVALDGVDLSVESGESLGLVGSNGAGKTTLFRLLVGHERPDEGAVSVAGVDPTDGPRVRERVGYLPEDVGFEPALTGREVVRFHARMRGLPAGERDHRVDAALGVVGLADDADRPTEAYSNGMTQRLGLATVLVGNPDVLLLDEPTAGLDPEGVASFNAVVDRVREERDVTVVLSSHVLSEVEQLCDTVAVLDAGTLVTAGSVADLTAGVGTTVTVTASLAAVDEAVTSVREASDGVSVSVSGDGLTVECPNEDVTAVLRALTEFPLDHVEVERPGLASVVRDATLSEGGELA